MDLDEIDLQTHTLSHKHTQTHSVNTKTHELCRIKMGTHTLTHLHLAISLCIYSTCERHVQEKEVNNKNK